MTDAGRAAIRQALATAGTAFAVGSLHVPQPFLAVLAAQLTAGIAFSQPGDFFKRIAAAWVGSLCGVLLLVALPEQYWFSLPLFGVAVAVGTSAFSKFVGAAILFAMGIGGMFSAGIVHPHMGLLVGSAHAASLSIAVAVTWFARSCQDKWHGHPEKCSEHRQDACAPSDVPSGTPQRSMGFQPVNQQIPGETPGTAFVHRQDACAPLGRIRAKQKGHSKEHGLPARERTTHRAERPHCPAHGQDACATNPPPSFRLTGLTGVLTLITACVTIPTESVVMSIAAMVTSLSLTSSGGIPQKVAGGILGVAVSLVFLTVVSGAGNDFAVFLLAMAVVMGGFEWLAVSLPNKASLFRQAGALFAVAATILPRPEQFLFASWRRMLAVLLGLAVASLLHAAFDLKARQKSPQAD